LNIIVIKVTCVTSREKAIPGAFWFAGDLNAGSNAYRCQILQFTEDKKIYRWRIWYVRRG
jgi:hypothetical protein